MIDALRGRPAVARLVDLSRSEPPPWICAITVEEVARGLRQSEREASRRFFDGVRMAPLGRAEGERAGAWRRDFARRGVTLAQADCLIAAAAMGVGACLATGNPRDFPMEGLQVEHWPAGR